MKRMLAIVGAVIILLNMCACGSDNSQDSLLSAQFSVADPSAVLPNTQNPIVSVEPSVFPDIGSEIGKLMEIKEGWTKLSDITDEDIVNHPFLVTTKNSGFHDIEQGFEFFADSMTGIQYALAVETEDDLEVSINFTVDAIDMELVLVRADGTVQHFSSGKEDEINVSLSKGENTFGVIGYNGSGSISVSIISDISAYKILSLQNDKLGKFEDYIKGLENNS